MRNSLSALLIVASSLATPSVAIEYAATCDGPDSCMIEVTGDKIRTSNGIEIRTDNVIGWAMVNDTSKSNAVFFKPRNEDYRFIIKYFDDSGARRVSQIGFKNFKPTQSFIAALELMTGLQPNHDQTGPTTKCTMIGKGFYSGTTFRDPAFFSGLFDRGVALGAGALLGGIIGQAIDNGGYSVSGGAWGAGVGGLAVYAMQHDSGNFNLIRNILSTTRSKPAPSAAFFDASFAQSEACKDQPLYSPLPLRIVSN